MFSVLFDLLLTTNCHWTIRRSCTFRYTMIHCLHFGIVREFFTEVYKPLHIDNHNNDSRYCSSKEIPNIPPSITHKTTPYLFYLVLTIVSGLMKSACSLTGCFNTTSSDRHKVTHFFIQLTYAGLFNKKLELISVD